MQPAQEAQPIPFAWLGGSQRAALDEIHLLLHAIVAENKKKAARSATPPSDESTWAWVDTARSNRALFIDGPRGMGKSSLLVTMVHGWTEARKGRAADWAAFGSESDAAEVYFGESAPEVRALPIRDFNPLAANIPLRGWLLESLHGLARLAESSPKARGKKLEPDSATPLELWEDLFHRAIAGWESIRSPTRAILEQIVDHRIQTSSGYNFERSFRVFVDGLLCALERAKVLPSANTLLVVPIDDLDLQVDRVRELLDAIRLMHHPRLVWLCAGDWRLLLDAVADDFEGAAMEVIGSHRRSKTHVRRAQELSRAVCAKTFPRRFSLRPLSLDDVLRAEGGRCSSLLNILTTKERHPLGDWLRVLASEDSAPLLTYRQLRQRLDRCSTTPSRADALALLQTLLDPEERHTQVLGDRPGPGPSGWIDYREVVEIRARSPRARTWNLLGGGRVNVGTRIVFTGTPQARLALSVAGTTKEVQVRGVTVDYGPLFAWTTLPGAQAWWPWVDREYSPVDLLRLAEQWEEWVHAVEANGQGVDALVYGWVAIQSSQTPAPEVLADEALLQDGTWERLVSGIGTSPDHALNSWADVMMPQFAAPEYGMSDRAAELFARACAKRLQLAGDGLLGVIVDTWHQNRRQILPNAIWQARAEEARQGTTGEAKAQLPAWPEDSEVDRLDKILQRSRPDAPWYHLRDPSGWWLRSPVLEGFVRWVRANPRRKFLLETEHGTATLPGRMLGGGIRASGIVATAPALNQVGSTRGLSTIVLAYGQLAAAMLAKGDAQDLSWRSVASQVRIHPGSKGVRVEPPVTLRAKTDLIGGILPYRQITRWEVDGLRVPDQTVSDALASWLGVLQLESDLAGVPMTGLSWSAPALLVLNSEAVPLPPFPRWADVQTFAEAWVARVAEFETAPMSEESRPEWLLVAYLDLALTLFSGPWLGPWRERTPPELQPGPVTANWSSLGQHPVTDALVSWVRIIRGLHSFRRLPTEFQEGFLAGDRRFNSPT